jgi:hypothetical protein
MLKMSHALSEGKYPKPPEGPAILSACREDFRKFKEKNGNVLLEHLSTLITDLEKRGLDPEVYIRQKENLEQVNTLVVRGEERVAFNLFTRAFPYCMPHRSLL